MTTEGGKEMVGRGGRLEARGAHDTINPINIRGFVSYFNNPVS